MKTFRYNTSGTWFKGNVHTHSTLSDGGKDFDELARMYSSAGYDFLCRTDHWIQSDPAEDNKKHPLLWLKGIEIEGTDKTGTDFHVLCLGIVDGIHRGLSFESAVESAHRQGAMLILAHPHWCGNSLEDFMKWPFIGVEIYNHVCHWINGKGNGLVHWEAFLKTNPDALAFCVDDTHLSPNHPGWKGGWIVVNAKERSQPEIMNAIKAGNFYSSCGPDFRSISFDGKELHLETSPVQFIKLVGPQWRGMRFGTSDGKAITKIKTAIPQDWQYVYAEIEDKSGQKAWTNTLFMQDVARSEPQSR